MKSIHGLIQHNPKSNPIQDILVEQNLFYHHNNNDTIETINFHLVVNKLNKTTTKRTKTPI